MINETTQIIIESKALAYNPTIISLWIGMLIINLGVTWAFKSKTMKWGRFMTTWFFTALISGIFLIFLISSPEQTANFFTKFLEWFK